MKINLSKLALVLLLCITVLSSCKTPMLYTSVDVLRAAEVEFSPDVNRLLIVNNTVVQPKELGHLTKLLNTPLQKITVETDSLALFTLSMLAQEIEDKDFFSSIDLEIETVRKDKNFNNIIALKPAEVKQLCKKYNADAILSLDKIKVTDRLEEFLIDDYDYFYLQELEVQCQSFWSIHYPDKRPIKTIHLKDSLFWDSEGASRKEAAKRMPVRKDALIDAALYVGKNSAKRFIPYWEKKTRYFFDSKDKTMKQAMDSVSVKNWEEAIKLFTKAAETNKSKKIQAEAENNIAIAYEFLGEFDKSYEYAMLSLEKFSNSSSLYTAEIIDRLKIFIADLDIRKKELKALNKQLGEE